MMARCYKTTTPFYHGWGGRGITVCERWHSLESFIEDMDASFTDGMSLDRINNNGNYEPANCRWATKTTQGRNTRRSVKAKTPFGVMQIGDASDRYNIPKKVLDWRVRHNWPASKLLMPVARRMAQAAYVIALMAFTSCSTFKYAATSPNGATESFSYNTLGGSSTLDSAGGTRLTQNHTKSFGQAAQTATAVAAGHFAAAQNASNNAASTAAGAQAAATQQAKIAADEAVLIEQIKAGVKP